MQSAMVNLEIVRKPCSLGNFRLGRGLCTVQGIVIHIADGTEAGTDAWFNNPASQVSAHYMVCKSGKIHQYVLEDDTAYHAGKVDRPTWKLAVDHPGTVNARTIGVEHEGSVQFDISELQYSSSAALLADICRRNFLELSDVTIAGHHAIRRSKPCPGKISVEKLVVIARQINRIHTGGIT